MPISKDQNPRKNSQITLDRNTNVITPIGI
jgi:hypothetical protein